ncbi:MAG: PIN domain-containing protein [Solirubrobacteraceae bacterium]
MSALVDTSVIAHGRTALDGIDQPWAVSVVTIGELHASVLLARTEKTRSRRLALLSAVLEVAPVLPVDGAAAACYGRIRAAVDRSAQNDLWIAATALAHGLLLVTADERQAALPGVDAALVSAS